MASRGPIWVDERNPIYRRGMAACLQAEGYTIAGESAGLRPEPDLAESSVLIFEVDAVGVDRAAALSRRSDVRLVGLVRETPYGRLQDPLRQGLAAVLPLRTLTPSRLLSCVQEVSDGSGNPHEQLDQREISVLRMLADGDSTRDIAAQLNYSERTVKNVVHDLLAKLSCRTRAQAVAFATRRGLI